ncbi:bifunctional folylpolyglutamate synthase/dihydrofolate synthase [Bacteroides sp. OttesenSCG-928-E20]|nr:bifunctional folylpolyglutamate synthase/dihydrofolate synthase [Bacteroides sp. OttesenSCG-928-N06]MDL2299848.1 bifunctional folylpolyglutamate synthase/dihydrofolate synthase [Bacteroides sp. OttesenSCG-928-E20]MDL2304260.1 bifunctional folylpolyglutamate synthase/dihydrofolate synthase [Bacteroides sp. OttesenSCG-928-D19]
MNYNETLDYLYKQMPLFQQIGSGAYKEGLTNTCALDAHFNHPHKAYRTIHVGGTNGKGSCSHTLAAMLQEAGYRVGLYTSPHLMDFRERIRVDGQVMDRDYVVSFVAEHRTFLESLTPSFFEVTTAMAFQYFASRQVDVAVIEVGLGGRLDCTNIISPDLCVITNISADHTALLGASAEEIAWQKAGIIKYRTPVVIGEATPITRNIFASVAAELNAPIVFAEDCPEVLETERLTDGRPLYNTRRYGRIPGELRGWYQAKNVNTVLHAVNLLRELDYTLTDENVRHGLERVVQLTGLMGRWQIVQQSPLMVCDTAHNVAGLTIVMEQLRALKRRRLHIVVGMVNDKDVSGMMKLLPADAEFYFTQASVERALPAEELTAIGRSAGLVGDAYTTVVDAVREAQKRSLPEDVIFVGGSSFVVADLLTHRDALNLH